MEKADNLSFPTIQGLGGRGQSLLIEVCIGAKWLIFPLNQKQNQKDCLSKNKQIARNSYVRLG
jgi:hypothetical protein